MKLTGLELLLAEYRWSALAGPPCCVLIGYDITCSRFASSCTLFYPDLLPQKRSTFSAHEQDRKIFISPAPLSTLRWSGRKLASVLTRLVDHLQQRQSLSESAV